MPMLGADPLSVKLKLLLVMLTLDISTAACPPTKEQQAQIRINGSFLIMD
jgi:hypothetical protein